MNSGSRKVLVPRAVMSWVAALVMTAPALAAQPVRPQVGHPLLAARELVLTQRYRDALDRLDQLTPLPDLNGNEVQLIEQMRLSAASGAGDLAVAKQAFERLGSMHGLNAADRLRAELSIVSLSYRSEAYADAVRWSRRYLREGGQAGDVRNTLIQAQYLSGDLKGAARSLSDSLKVLQRSGTRPPETELKLLLHVAARLQDNNLYVQAIEQLLMHYPNKAYWSDVLNRLPSTPGFSERFALDTYRLALATDNLRSAKDYVEMALLATQAGFPGEAMQVVEKGYASGVLGTGLEAERHQRLRKMLDQRIADDRASRSALEARAHAAKDGSALVQLGFNLATSGDAPGGIQLIRQGLIKGGLPANSARLSLGIAQVMCGQPRQAAATFQSVAGQDATGDHLAKLWRALAHARATGQA